MSCLPSLPAKLLVLGDGSLLYEGVTSILTGDLPITVTRILYTDDCKLFDLLKMEHPNAVFITEFASLDVTKTVGLIFSIPAAFTQYVIVIHADQCNFDIYEKAATYTPAPAYQKRSIFINTKEDFINFALEVTHFS